LSSRVRCCSHRVVRPNRSSCLRIGTIRRALVVVISPQRRPERVRNVQAPGGVLELVRVRELVAVLQGEGDGQSRRFAPHMRVRRRMKWRSIRRRRSSTGRRHDRLLRPLLEGRHIVFGPVHEGCVCRFVIPRFGSTRPAESWISRVRRCAWRRRRSDRGGWQLGSLPTGTFFSVCVVAQRICRVHGGHGSSILTYYRVRCRRPRLLRLGTPRLRRCCCCCCCALPFFVLSGGGSSSRSTAAPARIRSVPGEERVHGACARRSLLFPLCLFRFVADADDDDDVMTSEADHVST
jgi:hypothetical protein